jgi:phage/conjugal plasmid C-4 type zinc finger TraR family protein
MRAQAMDDMDFVQRQNEEFQAFALAQLKNREHDNNDSIYCQECKNEIPVKRRNAKPGCLRCIDCQIEFENREEA